MNKLLLCFKRKQKVKVNSWRAHVNNCFQAVRSLYRPSAGTFGIRHGSIQRLVAGKLFSQTSVLWRVCLCVFGYVLNIKRDIFRILNARLNATIGCVLCLWICCNFGDGLVPFHCQVYVCMRRLSEPCQSLFSRQDHHILFSPFRLSLGSNFSQLSSYLRAIWLSTW